MKSQGEEIKSDVDGRPSGSESGRFAGGEKASCCKPFAINSGASLSSAWTPRQDKVRSKTDKKPQLLTLSIWLDAAKTTARRASFTPILIVVHHHAG
jgi:hypothetical protein